MASTPEKLPPPSRRKDRSCSQCQTMIRRDNKSGLCSACVKKSDSFRANVAGAVRARYSDPEERKKTGDAMRRANLVDPTISERKSARMREIAADPAWKARNAENCRDRRLWEAGQAGRTAKSHVAQGKTFSRRHGLAVWCPEDYLEDARRLRALGIPLDEVKALIFEQQERDLERLRQRMGHGG